MAVKSLFEEAHEPQESPIKLRPYQEEAIEAVLGAFERGIQRGLIVMPTGTGKTTLFAELIRERRKRGLQRSLVLAHREELLEQAAARIELQNPGLRVYIEAADRKAPDFASCVVAGVATVGRANSERLSFLLPQTVICDEAHHAPADSYMNVFRRMGCFEEGAQLLGVTATPHRLDNKPLHGHERAIFEEVLYTYTLKSAIADGWLCDLRGYRVATGIDLSDVRTTAGDYNVGQLARRVNVEERNEAAFAHWQEVAPDRRTLIFCVDVSHAESVAQLWRDKGVAAEHVDGSMELAKRRDTIRRFRSGQTQVLANCQIVTEGFDLPEIACVLMLRPTQSWALYTQMVGRGLRTSEGKDDCLVIDVVDNTSRHELATVPSMLGLPNGLDLKGNKITDAAEKFEGLDDRQKASLFRRQVSYDDLSSVLKEVDLLAELAIPEALATATRFRWLMTGEAAYTLSCGSSESDRFREVRMTCDTIGRWYARLRSTTYDKLVELGEDVRTAFKLADELVLQVWPDAGRIVDTKARWNREPPTEKQVNFLRRLGVQDPTISGLSRGDASALITKILEGRNGRR